MKKSVQRLVENLGHQSVTEAHEEAAQVGLVVGMLRKHEGKDIKNLVDQKAPETEARQIFNNYDEMSGPQQTLLMLTNISEKWNTTMVFGREVILEIYLPSKGATVEAPIDSSAMNDWKAIWKESGSILYGVAAFFIGSDMAQMMRMGALKNIRAFVRRTSGGGYIVCGFPGREKNIDNAFLEEDALGPSR